MVFHNGSDCDYRFIITELANSLKENLIVQEKILKKYKTFSVSVTKDVKLIDKNGENVTETISYKLQFIDSARFMANLFSNLVDNPAEGIHKIKCKHGHDNKNAKRVELNTKIVSAVLNTQTLKIFLLEYKCLCCNKNYQKKFDKNDL